MSRDKEETGFGFKDGDKAKETLKLLKEHDLNYQRLTVRGLLGRAKRVLTMTKAEEKVKNIKEAIQIFEDWVDEHRAEPRGGRSDRDGKRERDAASGKGTERDEGKADTVPGLGFKDKDKAAETLKLLEGRDPDYQKLAVKGLIGRAKRVLTCTRDNEKIQNIKDAVEVFDDFLDRFEKANLGSKTLKYLPLDTVAAHAHSCAPSDRQKEFLAAYKTAGGDHKRLRTVECEESETTWDVVRNRALAALIERDKSKDLFKSSGSPTDEHLEQVLWAYSPRPDKLAAPGRKRKSDPEDRSPKKARA